MKIILCTLVCALVCIQELQASAKYGQKNWDQLRRLENVLSIADKAVADFHKLSNRLTRDEADDRYSNIPALQTDSWECITLRKDAGLATRKAWELSEKRRLVAKTSVEERAKCGMMYNNPNDLYKCLSDNVEKLQNDLIALEPELTEIGSNVVATLFERLEKCVRI